MEEPRFQCDFAGCGKWFARKARLNKHRKTHSPREKLYKCSVDGCNDAYLTNGHLQRHLERIHTKPAGSFVCSTEGCIASFETKLGLQNHTRVKHNKSNAAKLNCSLCSKSFSKKWQLKEHGALHTNCLPFECEVCKTSFKTYHQYKRHGNTHRVDAKKKTYACDQPDCNVVFEKWTLLLEHTRINHSISTCEICNKEFDKARIKSHKQIHEETREVFECTFEGCPRYYFFPRNLQQHIRSYHEGKGFTCSICNRKLSTKQKLLKHEKIMHKPKLPKKVKTKANMKLSAENNELTTTSTYCELEDNKNDIGSSDVSISTQPNGTQHNNNQDNPNNSTRRLKIRAYPTMDAIKNSQRRKEANNCAGGNTSTLSTLDSAKGLSFQINESPFKVEVPTQLELADCRLSMITKEMDENRSTNKQVEPICSIMYQKLLTAEDY